MILVVNRFQTPPAATAEPRLAKCSTRTLLRRLGVYLPPLPRRHRGEGRPLKASAGVAAPAGQGGGSRRGPGHAG